MNTASRTLPRRLRRLLTLPLALLALAALAPPLAGAQEATCGGLVPTIVGTAAGETINGTAGNDVISAGDGADTIDGLGGNDVVCGGSGNDRIVGGADVDTAAYTGSPAAVTASLAAGSASGEGSDTLVAVENLVGSPLADTLTGDGGANVLDGGAGADTLAGAGGTDTASFASSPAGVTASLATGTAAGNGADQLSGFESLLGSPLADTLTGDASPNVIDGGNGADVLDGGAGGGDVASFASASGVTASLATGTASGAGADRLAGFENLLGSPQGDTLAGDAAANVVDGGDGTDTCRGADPADRSLACEIGDSTIAATGHVHTYAYSLAAGKKVFFDAQPPTNAICSQLQWKLTAPDGTTVVPASGICADRGAVSLGAAGTYTVTITSAPGVGAYRFRFWQVRLPDVLPYTLGTTVANGSPAGAGNIETPQSEDHYTFAGTAGQRVFYDAIGVSGAQCAFKRTLYGPTGAIVPGADAAVCNDQGPIVLPATGTYTLKVYAVVNQDYNGVYSFRVTTVTDPQTFAYTLGVKVTKNVPTTGAGLIETPQGQDHYTFAAAAGQRLFYDALSVKGAQCGLRRTLYGPTGAAVPGTDHPVCTDLGPITLPAAGTYTLKVYAAVGLDYTGPYSFRLVDVAAPQLFAYTLGATVAPGAPAGGAGKIEAPQSQDHYTFAGTAGQSLFLDGIGLTGVNCGLRRTLYGPTGSVVPGTDTGVCNDVGPVTLAAAGTYTLKVYPAPDSDYVGTYSFRISNVPAPQVFAIALGRTVANGAPAAGAGNIETPQAQDHYTFSGTAAQKVTYDAIGVSGGQCALRRTIYAPNGTAVPGSDSGVCTDLTVTLPATGTYTVKVYAPVNADYTGIYSFTLLAA